MRLIRVGGEAQLSLIEYAADKIPPYAILSHTWGADSDEVKFEDMQDDTWQTKKGRIKLDFCAVQTKQDGLCHFWIDTCCINKAIETELQEAITSMFRWYAQSEQCYAYLTDVLFFAPDRGGSHNRWKTTLRDARWFTRGWTLQELLAPNQVRFYSQEGILLGDRTSLEQELHEITRIPPQALRGDPLSTFSVGERMSWAEHRTTTRIEDRAYCLAGLFGTPILPQYGEQEYAFDRLKHAIAEAFKIEVYQITQPSSSSTSSPLRVRSDRSALPTHSGAKNTHRKDLLKSLVFVQMESRHVSIKNADLSTCKWFLEHRDYMDWDTIHNPYRPERSFLWLIGKPGAGKSTLMKFALGNSKKTKSETDLIVSFFFNARGETLEKSTTGMYRSLLSQLLEQAPDLHNLLDVVIDQNWPLDTLCELLLASTARLEQRNLRIFVDALDECDERQVREMIIFFEDLSMQAQESGTRLYICFASRHYPAIHIQYGRQVILEDESGHDEDIAKYITKHLRGGNGTVVDRIKNELRSKASGIFLWVVLVIEILNETLTRGQVAKAKRTLDELPRGLSELFARILLRDQIHLPGLLLSLQWILFASRPLTREEYYHVLTTCSKDDPADLTPLEPEESTEEYLRWFVTSSSKGLATLTKSERPTVQFIHESVRDYLIGGDGLSRLWPEYAHNLQPLSHNRLKTCCTSYALAEVSTYVQHDQSLHKGGSDDAKVRWRSLSKAFPFLEYAISNIWYHADRAVSPTTPQAEFLRSFHLKRWLLRQNIAPLYRQRYYEVNTSLLYVLADNNAPRLISVLPLDMDTGTDLEGGAHHHPIFVAFANGDKEVVFALLSREERNIDPESALLQDYDDCRKLVLKIDDKGYTALHAAVRRGWIDVTQRLIEMGAHVDASNKSGVTALHLATITSRKDILQLLLENGANINFGDGRGERPIHKAVHSCHENILQLLLDNGANINASDKHSQQPLHVAVALKKHAIARLLVQNGADVNASDAYGQPPLDIAVGSGDGAAARLLLEKGANIDATDSDGNRPLDRAILLCKEHMVQLLLQRGASVGPSGKSSFPPLHLATRMDQQRLVKLLLEHGADVHLGDMNGRTALHEAAFLGHEEVVALLLESGANIDALDKNGHTALQRAYYGAAPAAVVQLLASTSV